MLKLKIESESRKVVRKLDWYEVLEFLEHWQCITADHLHHSIGVDLAAEVGRRNTRKT